MDHAKVIARTEHWLRAAVIGLNLCPFAKAVQARRQIRWVVSDATNEDALLQDLAHELRHLAAADPIHLDTTLLIHPQALTDFEDYNQFLDVADAALRALALDGVLQIASFHPQYRFEGSDADDIANATNRSPFPTLHLLREASIERAVASTPDAADIYERNIATLERLGAAGWARLMRP